MLNSAQNEKLWDKIKSKHVVNFATFDGEAIRSRPMKLLQEELNGTLWFITSLKSEIVTDIHRHPFVNITISDEQNDIYVSISGKAHVSDDGERLVSLCNSEVESWFDDGINDENIALIAVSIMEAEYWDVKTNSVKQAFNAMLSKANGRVPSQAEHRTLE